MSKKRRKWNIHLSIDNSRRLGIWLRRRRRVAGWLGNPFLALALLQPLDVGSWWREQDSGCVQEPATQRAAVVAPTVINLTIGGHQQTATSMIMGTPVMSGGIGRQVAALLATAETEPLDLDLPFQADGQVHSCPVILSL